MWLIAAGDAVTINQLIAAVVFLFGSLTVVVRIGWNQLIALRESQQGREDAIHESYRIQLADQAAENAQKLDGHVAALLETNKEFSRVLLSVLAPEAATDEHETDEPTV